MDVMIGRVLCGVLHYDVTCNSVTQCSTLVELGSEAEIRANAGKIVNKQTHCVFAHSFSTMIPELGVASKRKCIFGIEK